MVGTIYAYPLASTALPIAILFSRGIENIPDPHEKCRLTSKTAEKYHNQQLRLEMENIGSLVRDAADELQLTIDKRLLLYTEQPISFLERYILKEEIKSAKAIKRVQHFS